MSDLMYNKKHNKEKIFNDGNEILNLYLSSENSSLVNLRFLSLFI